MLLICECTLFFWLFCPSCRRYQGTAFLLLRAAQKKISTDLGTITVPSRLHLLLSQPRSRTPGESSPLFCRRFGQSGIKCRPLLTLWASAAVASGDLDFVFSHTSLSGTRGFAEAGRSFGLRSIFRTDVFVCCYFLCPSLCHFPQISNKIGFETLKKIMSFFFSDKRSVKGGV